MSNQKGFAVILIVVVILIVGVAVAFLVFEGKFRLFKPSNSNSVKVEMPLGD